MIACTLSVCITRKLLLGCWANTEAWFLSNLYFDLNMSQVHNFGLGLQSRFQELYRRDDGAVEGCVIVYFLLQHIWLRRNEFHFAHHLTLPLKIMETAAMQAVEFLEVNLQSGYTFLVPQPGFIPQVWKSPDAGSTKLNCDGTWVQGELFGGIGCVAWNEVGDVLAFLGKQMACVSVEQVELYAILHGLQLARSCGGEALLRTLIRRLLLAEQLREIWMFLGVIILSYRLLNFFSVFLINA